MKWYTSLYTRGYDGAVKLLDYTEFPDLQSAKASMWKLQTDYDRDFWHLECTLGSLDTSAKGVFMKRQEYSRNHKAARLQAEGEDRARKVLRSIRTLKPNSKMSHIQAIMLEVRLIKPYLSVAQYDTVLQELERQPIVRKLLKEAAV